MPPGWPPRRKPLVRRTTDPRSTSPFRSWKTSRRRPGRRLAASNDPARLFRFGSIPTRIERGDDGEPITRILTEDRLRHELAAAAHWVRWRGIGDKATEVHTIPPRDIVRDVLATPNIDLPILEWIVEARLSRRTARSRQPLVITPPAKRFMNRLPDSSCRRCPRLPWGTKLPLPGAYCSTICWAISRLSMRPASAALTVLLLPFGAI